MLVGEVFDWCCASAANMAKLVGEARPGLHFEKCSREVHARDQGLHSSPQLHQTGGLVQLVEWADAQTVAVVLLFHAHIRTGCHRFGDPAESPIELRSEFVEFLLALCLTVQHAADVRPSLAPGLSLQQLRAGIAPPFTLGQINVKPMQAVL